MLAGSLQAITAEYYIKAMGIKISYISLSLDATDNSIEVKTHSLKTSSIFPQINNVYSIIHDQALRPVSYSRVVRQKNLTDQVDVDYNYTNLLAKQKRKQNNSNCQYAIAQNSRDVFSFLAYVISGKAVDGTYNIDANGIPWQANIQIKGVETVKTQLGKYPATRYDISFTCLTDAKTPYVDMVTCNLVNEATKLTFWVSQNNLAVKAVVKKNALAMTWDLVSVKP